MGLISELCLRKCGWDIYNWPSRLVAAITILTFCSYSFVASILGIAAINHGWFQDWKVVNGTVVHGHNNNAVMGSLYCQQTLRMFLLLPRGFYPLLHLF